MFVTQGIKSVGLRGYSNSPTIECSIASSLADSPQQIQTEGKHHGTYAPAAAVREKRARSAHVGRDARVSLRQASPDLCDQPEQSDQGHGVREPVAGRDRQEVVGR